VKRWYAVHTYSGHEQKVRDKLEKKIAEAKLQERFGQIVIAKEEFVEMEIDDETRFLVTSTAGVLSFIGTTSGPQPLEQEDIDRILGRIERKPSKEHPEIPYQVGEQVRVIDGPFTGFQGLVDDVDGERGKIKVMVSIFGRATPVELDFLQVESA
jgi:transcriptional antiterminator NusG